MFRNPQGKILRRMFDHAVVHDLAGASSTEKGYIFLLMSAAGNSACPDGSFATNGSMQIQFPDLPAAFNALRSRGYLVDPLPLEELLPTVVVSDLKVLLKSHGLPVSGKRAELVERLLPALTDEDVAHLRETHSFLLPSPLGYEMIYSLYDLWERRQIALMEAISAGNTASISASYKHMPSSVGFWDDSPTASPFFPGKLQQLSDFSSPSSAFAFLCGFSPELNIRELPKALYVSSVYTRAAFARSLEQYRASGLKKVLWHSCGASEACDALNGKVFRINNVPDCPVCPGCSCWVTGVVELPGEHVPVTGNAPRSAKSASPRSSSAFKQYAFAPLPDSDPVVPHKRHPIWLILGIVIAIVILWRLCFS